MADELSVSMTINFLSGAVSYLRSLSNAGIDVSAAKYIANVQTVGTSAEAIGVGDLAAPGYAAFQNLDDTNYVEIRDGDSGADLVKLLPGDIAVFRLATATPYAIANTAAVELEYVVFDT